MIEMICEFGQTDSLVEALAQVVATKEIGATHAKWQLFHPDRLAGPEATRYWDVSLGGNDSQKDMFAEFGCLSEDEWREVKRACDVLGVEFMATPFDLEAVDLLERLGVSAYKIASGDLTYRALIEKVAATRKRVYLSTGAASYFEMLRALELLDGCEAVPMGCDLVYPCPASQSAIGERLMVLRCMRMGRIDKLRFGLSDHTQEIVTGAVAVSLGATVLEKHVTLDKSRDRPDDRMALTVEQAKDYKRLADDAYVLIQPPEGDPEAAARIGARRSAHATRDIAEGETLTPEDVAWLRPCPPNSIGADWPLDAKPLTLTRPVKAGERIPVDAVA